MPAACRSCGQVSVMAEPGEHCPRCGLRIDSALECSIELAGVSKAFAGKQVLDRLWLHVEPGESLVVVGMSGSGKSVLIEHILGLMEPDSGRVRIRGVELSARLRESQLREVRQQIGMVFQGSALIDSLTVLENVALPLRSRGIPDDKAKGRAGQLLQEVGIAREDWPIFPASLSGGMQKRVSIARALTTEPAILVYDEPTTGLDAATAASITRLLRRVHAARPRRTSITITHDYLCAGLIGDRVLYLNRASGQLQPVLDRDQICQIRSRHGGDMTAATRAVREQVESWFERLPDDERPPARTVVQAGWAEALVAVLGSVFYSLGAAATLLPRVRLPMDLQELFKRFLDVGCKSVLVAAVAGLFLGMMMALQIALALGDLREQLPQLVGTILVDKIGPLFVGLLLTGRLGASIGAEIGGKRLSRQFDALRAMAISPETFWLSPILWASIASLPLLLLVLESSALGGACLVSSLRFPTIGSTYFLHHMLDKVHWSQALFGLLRTAVFGGAITLVAYAEGAKEKRSSEDVGTAATLAVVGASLAVICLDLLFAFVTAL